MKCSDTLHEHWHLLLLLAAPDLAGHSADFQIQQRLEEQGAPCSDRRFMLIAHAVTISMQKGLLVGPLAEIASAILLHNMTFGQFSCQQLQSFRVFSCPRHLQHAALVCPGHV